MTANDTMNQLKEKNTAAPARKTKAQTMAQYIQALQPQIKKALPSVITPERFTRIALTALQTTPKLANTDPASFLGALMQAAQLGLEPNTPLGQAYLIPYGSNTQFQIGYKGMIELAHRSGQFKTIYAKEVYEKDEFSYEFGLEPKLRHVPYAGMERGAATYYYAVYTLVNGGFGFEVMGRNEIEAFAKRYSKSYSSGPWQTDFDEMAKKTVLKKLLKYAPISTEFQRGVSSDEKEVTFDKDSGELSQEYIDVGYEETQESKEGGNGETEA